MLITPTDRQTWPHFDLEQIKIVKELGYQPPLTEEKLNCLYNPNLTAHQIKAILMMQDNGFSDNQISHVIDLFDDFLFVDTLEEWMQLIITGYHASLSNEDISLFVNDRFEIRQAQQILRGLLIPSVKPNVKIYAIEDEPWENMEQIRYALMMNVTSEQAQFMVDYKLSWDKIMEVSNGFLHGITLKQMEICVVVQKNPFLITFEPDKIRQLINGFLCYIDQECTPILTEEQVRFYAYDHFSSEVMRQIRLAFEHGLTQEQIGLLLLEPNELRITTKRKCYEALIRNYMDSITCTFKSANPLQRYQMLQSLDSKHKDAINDKILAFEVKYKTKMLMRKHKKQESAPPEGQDDRSIEAL